jgi:hypothetical protein
VTFGSDAMAAAPRSVSRERLTPVFQRESIRLPHASQTCLSFLKNTGNRR